MKSHEPLCRETDKPIAGLIKDLNKEECSTIHWWSGQRNLEGRPGRKIRPEETIILEDLPAGWPEAASKGELSSAIPMM